MKKILFKIVSVVFCALLMVVPFVPEGGVMKVNAATMQFGLTVDDDGTVLLNGTPFYGFGTNQFTSIPHHWENPLNEKFTAEFELMQKYDIPFVRLNFGGYWETFYDLYDENPEFVIQCMRDVVKCAEKYHIGIIASLLWYDSSVPLHVGEKRSDFGNVKSKTLAYTKEYLTDIINEFKESPAIWAWEIGNEYNLGADLCDPNLKAYLPNGPNTIKNPTYYDYYTSEELVTYYTEVGKHIRKLDPNRMIISGNADMRPAMVALNRASRNKDSNHMWNIDWTGDTRDQFIDMTNFYNPNPINSLSVHVYDFETNRFGKTLSYAEYLKVFTDAGKKSKKPVFLGEWGSWTQNDDAEELNKFMSCMKAVLNSGIQISATWQFEQSSLVATDATIDGKKLKLMQAENKKYQTAGKQNVDEYWKLADQYLSTQDAQSSKPNDNSQSSSKPVNNVTSRLNSSNTTSKSTGNDSVTSIAEITETGDPVDSYLVTRSKYLTINGDGATILLTKEMDADLFGRSMVLKNGYSMTVVDEADVELSSGDMVADGCQVLIYDESAQLINRLTISVNESISSNQEVLTQPEEVKKPGGGFKWWHGLLVALGAIALAGVGVWLYFYLKGLKAGKGS